MPKHGIIPDGIRKKDFMPPSRSTPGKAKGIVPSPKDKIMAKRSRSYKDNYYSTWCRKYSGDKTRKGATTS